MKFKGRNAFLIRQGFLTGYITIRVDVGAHVLVVMPS